VPAAAVIPAPIAYIKVVAVKKLVVEPRGRSVAKAPRLFSFFREGGRGGRRVTGPFSALQCQNQLEGGLSGRS